MTKKARNERLDRFRRALALLEEKFNYTSKKIADRLGVHPTNLSSYKSGTKNPGEKILTRFYMEFNEEIKQQPYAQGPNDKNPSSEVEEAVLKYLSNNERAESFRMLRADYEHLQGNFTKIADSNLKMATAQEKMSDGHHIMIQDSHTLITLLVSKIANNGDAGEKEK